MVTFYDEATGASEVIVADQAAKLRILDPACGSGSFLIGAYQRLMDWHRDWYVEDGTEKHAKEVYQGPGGEWRLTTAERKRILLNNIYGVDIDPQAIEVTKLSLLLKVLEGESDETLSKQLQLFHERALPDLSDNIKCGNSLIGSDFYRGKQISLFSEEERYSINCFDWDTEFSNVLSQGGFDAVIGNPPYLNIDDTWGQGDERQRYIKKTYSEIYNDKTDILFYFFAKAIQLSKGVVGLIVSRAFLEAFKADKLRSWLATKSHLSEVIDFQSYYVFKGVGISTAVVILDATKVAGTAQLFRLRNVEYSPQNLDIQKSNDLLFSSVSVPQASFDSKPWIFPEQKTQVITKKVDAAGELLGNILIVGQGMQTGRNNVFGKLAQTDIEKWKLVDGQFFLRARNSDILRYRIRDGGEYLLYLEDVNNFDDLPEGVQEYLRSHESELRDRAAFKRGDCIWWRYTWPLHKKYKDKAKLLCPYLLTINRFAFDGERKFLGLTDTTVLYDGDQPEDIRYIACLLNSKLLTFRFKYIGKLKSAGIREYFWNSVSKLPIRRIDFSESDQVSSHDRLVNMFHQTTALIEDINRCKTPWDKKELQRQFEVTDTQIDHLVYELYGLTDEEISIVEHESADG